MTIRVVLLSFLLAGCSTVPFRRSVGKEDLAKIKKVGVVSLLGNQMNHTFIGTTVFSNKDQAVDVADWKMDSAALSQMIKILRAENNFSSVEAIQGEIPAGLKRVQVKDKLLELAKAQGKDTLLVLWPTSYTNVPNVDAGYGLFKRSAFGVEHTYGYLLAQLVIYDVASGEIVAWHWNYDELVGKPNVFSHDEVPWKDDPSQYTKAERDSLQKVIKGHTLSGIRYALQAMNLAKGSSTLD